MFGGPTVDYNGSTKSSTGGTGFIFDSTYGAGDGGEDGGEMERFSSDETGSRLILRLLRVAVLLTPPRGSTQGALDGGAARPRRSQFGRPECFRVWYMLEFRDVYGI